MACPIYLIIRLMPENLISSQDIEDLFYTATGVLSM
jgi:hypothetical protein